MRFITYHKADRDTEASVLPTPELMAGMGQLIGDMAQAGVFEAGEGLRASAFGVRADYRGGKRSLAKGPFTGGNELPAVIVLVKVAGQEAALPWADRYAQIYGDIEIDLRPLHEAWHMGMMPAPPAGTPERWMLQIKANAASESGQALPAAQSRQLQALLAEMKQAGVLLVTEFIRPSSEGLRVQYVKGEEPRVIDGPFAESKELIAGYCIMQAKDRAEALAWCNRFGACFPQAEVDIRPLDAAPAA
ncbi:MAG TPA: YciI family protein [Burkholderiales bacterium]|nr:YciI family protein [Burkholderiales bacterium]